MAKHITLISLLLWCLIFLVFLFMMAQSQTLPSTEGFISLDCGLPNNQSYTDSVTKLTYTSDSQFIDTGVIKKIDANYINNSLPKYEQTVRSFPDGIRNCYMFDKLGTSDDYLVRATFMYGNYDGLQSVKTNKPIVFNISLGANIWRTVNISEASKEYIFEAAVSLYSSDILWVCLVSTNSGVPFISALELRQMKSSLYSYIGSFAFLSFMYRFNYGETNQTIRYPYDQYDRIWQPYIHNRSEWMGLATNRSIDMSFSTSRLVPSAVLQTAVAPINSPNLTAIQWRTEKIMSNPDYYALMYIADLQPQTTNASREFMVEIDGKRWPYISFWSNNAYYLQLTTIYGSDPIDKADDYVVKLYATANSTLPPLINAIEIYARISIEYEPASSSDMEGIMGIKKTYGLTRNWIGDPCLPKNLKWNGVNCTYFSSGSYTYAYITTINLTSSGLKGEISESFKSMGSLETLDLSCNNLTGPIPDFLANMRSLVYLNLAGNSFTGPVPDNLQKQANNGFVTLILESDQCGLRRHTTSKKKNKIIIVAPIASVVLLAIATFVVWKFCRKTPEPKGSPPLHVEFRQFTYEELKLITNDFLEVIGRGGFGSVYLGLMNDGTQVAIKVPNIGTTEAMRQFLSEARSLMQVHHRNLVTLIGYSMEEKFYGLVYEYMSQGSLYDHLFGNKSTSRVLNWGERLRIAFEAAQGLDYLHTGCMIAHRDVKSSNILLGQNFEAKVADFGLSKMLYAGTGMSTISLCGTPGYIDPEVHATPLSEKSDVYSFGVVLLEIITGETPIMPGRENVNLIEHVNRTIKNGNIADIVDSRLDANYTERIVWKVIDLAIRCTKDAAKDRPIMAEVVTALRDCLSEENRLRDRNVSIEEGMKSQASSIDISLVEMGPSVR